MAIKNTENKTFDNIEEIKPATQTELEALGLETEFSEKTESSFSIDTDNLDKIDINELDIGTSVDGMPEFVLFDNSDRTNANGTKRKWDSICLHLVDITETDEYGEQSGEFVVAYSPCPRPDKDGFISNVFANGFYHGTFCLIYSYLRALDETNVLDPNGNIINKINKINIVKLLEKLNDLSSMEIKVGKGANGDTDYLTYMITKME